MKQWQLAEAIEVKQNAISRIECGDRSVSIERLRLIARVLETDVGQLLAREDNRMGLDEEGWKIIGRLQDNPGLAALLSQLDEFITKLKSRAE